MEELSLKINVDSDAAMKHIAELKASISHITDLAKTFRQSLGGSFPDNIPNGLRKTRQAADEANRSLINFRSSLGGISGSSNSPVFTIDILGAAEKFYDIIKSAVELFVDGVTTAGKAVASQENLNLAYRLNFGEKAGKEYREDIERFSRLTSYTTQQIESHILPLYRAFGKDQGKTQFAIAADLSRLSGKPTDINNTADYIDFATKLHAGERVTKRQISSLLQGTSLDINDLAKAAGGNDVLKAAQKGGDQNAANKVLYGFAKLIEKANLDAGYKRDQNGNVIGSLGKPQTLDDWINKLTGLPQELLSKLADTPALKELTVSLADLYDAISPSSTGGKQIISALGKEFRDIVKGIKEFISDPAKIDALIGNTKLVIHLFGELGEAVLFLAKNLETILTAFGVFFAGIGAAMTAFGIATANPILGLAGAATALFGAGLGATGSRIRSEREREEEIRTGKLSEPPSNISSTQKQDFESHKFDNNGETLGFSGFHKQDMQPLPLNTSKDMNGNGVIVTAPVTIHVSVDKNTNQEDAKEMMGKASEGFGQHILKVFEQAVQQAGIGV